MKNEGIVLKATGMTHDGLGVASLENGKKIFVENLIEGETGICTVKEERSRFSKGVCTVITEKSLYREQPPCPVYSRCGGCCFLHVSYEKELEIKRDTVTRALKRTGMDIPEIPEVIPSEQFERNKVTLHYKADKTDTVFGFYSRKTHSIIEISECILIPREIKEAAKEIGDIFSFSSEKFNANVSFRINRKRDEMSVLADFGDFEARCEDELKRLDTGGIIKCIAVKSGNRLTYLFGRHIEDTLSGQKVYISPDSFYQINPAQAEKAYAEACRNIPEPEKKSILELYSGTGTISLSLFRVFRQCVGIEINRNAVEDAVHNAEANGAENIHFICDDSSDMMKHLEVFEKNPEVILVDPPRSGLSGNAVNSIKQVLPDYISYISCNPETLSRDISILSDRYTVKSVTPIDFFPRTSHVETVVLLSRKQGQGTGKA